MSNTIRKKEYALKKVGKFWLLGRADGELKRCAPLTSAEEVDIHDNFLIADETIYEIKEDENGQVYLVKVEEMLVLNQQHPKSYSHTMDDQYANDKKSNKEEKPFETSVTDESNLEQEEYNLFKAGQTEATSSIHVSFATNTEGATGGGKNIQSSTSFANYVEVRKIQAGLDEDSLRKELFQNRRFPIGPPKLVYCRGSDEALLICNSDEDAVKLSQCTNLEPFEFAVLQSDKLIFATHTVDHNIVRKMVEYGTFDSFKNKVLYADIEIKGESPLVLVAPTPFQLTYVNFMIEELTSIESTASSQNRRKNKVKKEIDDRKESFKHTEIIKDVPEYVREVFLSSRQFREIKRTVKNISYDNGSLILECAKPCNDKLDKINEMVEDLRTREWVDEQLDETNCDKPLVDRWCDEMNVNIKYECCKYIAGKGKVLIYAKNYEDAMKVQHFFKSKIGKIKQSARGKRECKAITDDNALNIDSYDPEGAKDRNPNKRYGSPENQSSHDQNSKGKNLREFSTKENIMVYVYEANILQLNVDCIVNAASENLQHGGGVAAMISRAAGYKLNDESREYVRRNGIIPVGKACTTTPGNLTYDCVIHAVGPKWSDYYPHYFDDVKQCKVHLYQAIYNSFLEAEKRGIKSIALPAISSAIFGVPDDICVHQYAKATLDYSRKTKDQASALTEIHFIDKNKNIVKKVQDAFDSVFVKGDMSKYDLDEQSQSTSYAEIEMTKVEPLSFFDDKLYAYAYLLHGFEENKLLLSRGDMLKVYANAVVIPVDVHGRRGNIANALTSKMPGQHYSEYNRTFTSESRSCKPFDVLMVPGYECGFAFILHAVLPVNANDKDINERKYDVKKLYNNMFSTCKAQSGINAVVTTLLGADIRTCAEMFLQSYLDFYSKTPMKKNLRVHLVCKEDPVYHIVKDVLDRYVLSRKSILTESPSASIDVVKPANVHVENSEEDNCVLCMDTVTDPETLICGHVFCKECIEEQFKFKQACPICGQVCGIITGDQPQGYMSHTTERYTDCSGYEGSGRIMITYNFPSGRQGPNHPKPGTFYKGITRVAYLPKNPEGRKIHAMLKVAFERKIVFTIGNSRTTGQEGVITWNDIHHKTNPKPHTQYGYPDPGYLERVKDELAVKGVTEKDIPK